MSEKSVAQVGWFAPIRCTEDKEWIDVGSAKTGVRPALVAAETCDRLLGKEWAKANELKRVRAVIVLSLPDPFGQSLGITESEFQDIVAQLRAQIRIRDAGNPSNPS
jgi:hypothetical protein